jgi:hypothetical protein
MNKNLMIFGMAVLLLSVGLSGCIEDPFEGTWTDGILEISYIPEVMSIYITELTFTGGATHLTLNVGNKTITKATASGTYETEGNELYIHLATGITFSFAYSFDTENGNDILYLDGIKFIKA